MSTAINLDFLELGANLDSEDIVCYDSPIKTYDSFDSLPIGFLDEKDVRPGRLGRIALDGGLNTGFAAEGLDSILSDSLFHDSSGGGVFDV